MTLDDIRNLDDPSQLGNQYLLAIWYDLHDNWDTAHSIVQEMYDTRAEWIHAYLHRKEGDIGNSKYWYRRCGKPYPGRMGFDAEIATILSDLQH
jgi:hypothetical protein